MIATLVAAVLVAAPQTAEKPVTLARVWRPGQVVSYNVDALVTIEQRSENLRTFLPRDYGFEYTFRCTVASVDEDGNARMRYERTRFVQIDGEFGETPEKRTSPKEGLYKLDVRMSPINEVLSLEEAKAPARNPKVGMMRALAPAIPQGQITEQIAGQFTGQLIRMVLMVGSLDSSMDFAPRMEYRPVRKGTTWKRTVGYAPQALSGAGGRQANQRLDYTYTYQGIVDVDGKKYHRIEGNLKFENDIWPFMLQQFGLRMQDTPFSNLILKFDQKLTFDLDLKTFATVRGMAEADGSSRLALRAGDQQLEEQRFSGYSKIALAGSR